MRSFGAGLAVERTASSGHRVVFAHSIAQLFHWLEIPVTWAETRGARVIVESRLPNMDVEQLMRMGPPLLEIVRWPDESRGLEEQIVQVLFRTLCGASGV